MDISGLQFPLNADAPVFNYGGGINGNPKKASLAYGDCLLNGGNSVECGASAWKAGVDDSTSIQTTDPCANLTGWAKIKCSWQNIGNYKSLGSEVNNLTNNGSSMGIDAGSIGSWVSNPTRIVVLLIGLLLFTGGLFMLGLSSFNPVSRALETVNE